MKTPFFRFALYAIVCLIYTHFNRVGASSLLLEEDYKPENRHYARTFAANLDVGEPRTVRMIYFLPNDRPYRADVVQRMKGEIIKIQDFYAEAMKAHGYDMTFKIETDAKGEPMVHRVDGQHSEIHYIDDTSYDVRFEIEQVFDIEQNIYFIVIDSSISGIGTGVGRVRVTANGGHIGKNGGTVLIHAKHFQQRIEADLRRKEGYKLGYDKLSTHEIGHAFGLSHDFRSGGYVMSYGAGRNRARSDGPDQDRLSKCNADRLSVHPYFNPDIPTERGQPPTIELASPNTYPTGSRSVDIQIKTTDLEGVHQVILFLGTKGPFSPVGFPEVKACHKLTGQTESVVNFEYDGDIPSTSFTKLSMYSKHKVRIAAIDINGDMYKRSFTLSENPLEQVHGTEKPVKILGEAVATKDNNSYQMQNLPVHARIRIGKGGAGRSDRAAAFSPDGQHLAVSSSIGIWLYDTVTYQELALLSSQYSITSIAFSPNGNTIVGASRHGFISNQVWSTVTKERIATFNPDGGTVGAVAFSPDGRTIASADGKTIILWDVVTEKELIRMKSEDFVRTISFSHDGALIASAGRHGLIKLWDVNTGQNMKTLSHKADVNSIAFSPTENMLASGSNDTTVKLWNIVTGTEISIIENPGRILAVAFSPDGETLAWTDAGWPDTINLWDVATQSFIAIYDNDTAFNMNSIALSPDKKTFVTVDSHFDFVKVWDITTGNTIDLGHIGLTPISFSPNSTMLASGGRRGVRLWDVNTGENVAAIPVEIGPRVQLMSFLPDGRTLAYHVDGEDFTRLWDVTTQTQVGTIENESMSYWAFSPDGKTLASASGRIIELWNVETRQNIATLEGHLDTIYFLSYSPDGNTLASIAVFDETVRLWDIATKQNTKTFEGDSEYAAFSPDGTMLAFHKLNVGVKVWNLVTQEMAILEEEDFMAFLPNSTMMLLRSFNWESGQTVSVWDAKTSTHVATLDPTIFQNWKRPIFSPDGKTLAIMGQDSTILFDPKVLYSQLPSLAPININLTNALQTELLTNYPNPFNPETWIPFRLAEDADVALTIYDISGRVVRMLDIGHKAAGVYETRNKAIYWDGKNDLGERMASGVYFYHLEAGEYTATKRMVILK